MKKTIMGTLMCLFLVLFLVACGESSEEGTSEVVTETTVSEEDAASVKAGEAVTQILNNADGEDSAMVGLMNDGFRYLVDNEDSFPIMDQAALEKIFPSEEYFYELLFSRYPDSDSVMPPWETVDTYNDKGKKIQNMLYNSKDDYWENTENSVGAKVDYTIEDGLLTIENLGSPDTYQLRDIYNGCYLAYEKSDGELIPEKIIISVKEMDEAVGPAVLERMNK